VADRHIAQVISIADELADPIPRLLANVAAGFVAMHRADPATAVERLRAADAEDERERLREPGFRRYMGDLVAALVETGDLAGATEVHARLRPMAEATDRPSARAAAARGAALLATDRGEFDAALASCAEARAQHARAFDPFQLGRTLLVEGRIRRRHREKHKARQVLDEARALFEQVGAKPWVERAIEEGERAGGRPSGSGPLTETERRIAELVVMGKTNREVGAALFISTRTVEANLTRIYRKLDVPSRAALGQRLAAEPDTH
jgi:DNA-binding CsgD family transcriptional regulator